MLKYFLPFAVIVMFGTVNVPDSALGAEKDYSTIINLAGRQRMFTQKMTKEALLIALDVDKAGNIENLKKTSGLFDNVLKGLRNGDDALGLAPTKKPKILKRIGNVDGLWAEFKPEIDAVASSGAVSDEQLSALASKNMPLLKDMNKVVKLYEAAASGGDMNPALAVAINLAGRQRMLTQKMTKEYLLVAKGHEVEANKAALSKTMALFDTTLNSLIDGDDSNGLSPAPTEEIAVQLKTVKTMWAAFKANLEKDPSPEVLQAIAKENLPLLKEMNKAVGMFAAL